MWGKEINTHQKTIGPKAEGQGGTQRRVTEGGANPCGYAGRWHSEGVVSIQHHEEPMDEAEERRINQIETGPSISRFHELSTLYCRQA